MRILIVDDHAVVREGVRQLLSRLPNVEIFSASDGREAVTEFWKSKPAIVILDIDLGGSSGLELLHRLRAQSKATRAIVFSMHANPGYVVRAIRAGAIGYVSKSAPAEELVEAVKQASRGQKYIDRELAGTLVFSTNQADDPYLKLSDREVEILRLLGDGKSLAQMAATFGVAYKTVANSCSLLKTKLGLERTADLIRLSIERRDK